MAIQKRINYEYYNRKQQEILNNIENWKNFQLFCLEMTVLETRYKCNRVCVNNYQLTKNSKGLYTIKLGGRPVWENLRVSDAYGFCLRGPLAYYMSRFNDLRIDFYDEYMAKLTQPKTEAVEVVEVAETKAVEVAEIEAIEPKAVEVVEVAEIEAIEPKAVEVVEVVEVSETKVAQLTPNKTLAEMIAIANEQADIAAKELVRKYELLHEKYSDETTYPSTDYYKLVNVNTAQIQAIFPKSMNLGTIDFMIEQDFPNALPGSLALLN